MIGREAIQVWHSKAPWVRWEHVEQDLVISRAMFQRKKLRDLFDVEYALKNGDVDDSLILRCWRRYMSTNGHTPPTSREFVENMDGKMSMPDYIADIDSILRRDVSFDAQLAYRLVRERLIEKIDIR